MSSSGDGSEEEDYEVEKITGHKRQNEEYVYKVRWKGYEKDQDTWEPQSNLDNCQQAIDDYWARRKAEKEKKRQEEAAASNIDKVDATGTPKSPEKPAVTKDSQVDVTSKASEGSGKSPSKEKEKQTTVKSETKATLQEFPMASSAEKTESWTADTVKFTTGVDVPKTTPPKEKKEPTSTVKIEPGTKLKSEAKTKPSVIDSSDAGSISSSKASKPVELKKAKKHKMLPSEAPIIKKKPSLESSAGLDYKLRFENLRKDYEKLKKNYEKVNQQNQELKSKAEKLLVDTKTKELDTSDLYTNGVQAFIETQRKPAEVIWEAVKKGDHSVVSEAVFNMAVKEMAFQWDSTDSEGKTMLIYAVENRDEQMVRTLLSCAALDVNSRNNNDGATALITACDLGLLNIASLLLEAGAHVNKITLLNGESALMKAAKNGHEDIVTLLLEFCADTNLKTEQNQIAQQMARLKNHQICVKLIEQHYSWIKKCIDEKIKLYLKDAFEIGNTPLFPMHCHSIKESAVVNYTVDITTTSTTPGGGYLLFLAHCKIEPKRNNIMARLHGPCFVQQVRMNSQILPAPVAGANFILGFIPKSGKNQLQITLVNAPWSDTKLVICAYAVSKKKLVNASGGTGGSFNTAAAMGQSFRSTLPK